MVVINKLTLYGYIDFKDNDKVNVSFFCESRGE